MIGRLSSIKKRYDRGLELTSQPGRSAKVGQQPHRIDSNCKAHALVSTPGPRAVRSMLFLSGQIRSRSSTAAAPQRHAHPFAVRHQHSALQLALSNGHHGTSVQPLVGIYHPAQRNEETA
ncbi:hypothetical protein ABW21_db0208542 [Orbilia brochopaga]|nr:hypothetical protein ABW21_db0208542 [Drechslerella brochopaga]